MGNLVYQCRKVFLSSVLLEWKIREGPMCLITAKFALSYSKELCIVITSYTFIVCLLVITFLVELDLIKNVECRVSFLFL